MRDGHQGSCNNGMAPAKGTYQRYERKERKAVPSRGGLLIADSTGMKTGKSKGGSPLNPAIKVTGREVRGKQAVFKKDLVTA